MGERLSAMPFFRTRPASVRGNKELKFNWDNFSGGLNTLFKNTEIARNELSQAENIMLVGKGVPTKRWGTAVYFMSGLTGVVRGMSGFYQKDDTNQLLALTDHGLLTRRSNASYVEITGVSWASGNNAEMSQIDDKMYIVDGVRPLARYSNPTLVGFATIGQPTDTFTTQISGTSGTNTVSYRLAHTTDAGETAAADSYQIANQPLDLIDGTVRVEWANASTASGVRTGTNIYAGTPGNETFRASVDGEATEWDDDGSAITSLFAFAPTTDTTGGIIAKYIIRFQDRLVYAGIKNDPTLVVVSGAEPSHEKLDFANNGGVVRIEPDSGDNITGLAVKGERIIVFKERSVWQILLKQRVYKTVSDVELTALDPQPRLITRGVGCASHRSIAYVGNDIFFLANGGRGVFFLGNEPGFLGDILRTNEISVKIRPVFESLTPTEEQNACAIYFNNKFFIGIPGKNQTWVFDRERAAWYGPWTFDARMFHVYYDSDGNAKLLKGDDDTTNIRDISQTYPGDSGVAVGTILRTKREDFGDWTKFKNVKSILTLWRNLAGSVNVDIRLEERTGNTITAKSFTVTTSAGNSGFGADLFGNTQMGDTEPAGVARDLSEVIRHAYLQKTARNVEIVVKTDGLNDNYELMEIAGEGHIQGEYRRTAWKV